MKQKQIKRLITNKKVLSLLGVLLIIIIGVTITLISIKPRKETTVNNDIKEKIEIEKVEDGSSFERKIVVSNTSGKDITYDLVWNNVTNEFKTQSDLLYSISNTGHGAVTIGTSQVPVVDSQIMTKIKLAKDRVHTYTLKVWYDKSKNSKDTDASNFKGYVVAVKHE